MDIRTLQLKSHAEAVAKGFWDEQQTEQNFLLFSVVSKIMLCVTELAEGVQAIRSEETSMKLGEELADTIIRIADLAEALKIDLNKEIEIKMEFNKTRPAKHGRRF